MLHIGPGTYKLRREWVRLLDGFSQEEEEEKKKTYVCMHGRGT
jgi:hypothetical protein